MLLGRVEKKNKQAEKKPKREGLLPDPWRRGNVARRLKNHREAPRERGKQRWKEKIVFIGKTELEGRGKGEGDERRVRKNLGRVCIWQDGHLGNSEKKEKKEDHHEEKKRKQESVNYLPTQYQEEGSPKVQKNFKKTTRFKESIRRDICP